MALDQGTETIGVVTKQRRTWRTEINSERGAVPDAVGLREIARLDANGAPFGETDRTTLPNARVAFSFTDVAARSFTLADGTKLTGAQLAEAIALVIDTIDGEQLAAIAAREAALAQPQQ